MRKRKISGLKKLKQRARDLVEQIQTKKWKKGLRKLNRQYVALGVVFVGVTIGAIDWAANRLTTGPEEKPATLAPASNNKDPLTSPPWSFFHPAWKEESGWLVRIARPTNSLTNSASKVRDLVTDPEGRTELEFQVPDSLKNRVGFWMEIYSRYNSRMRVVHDRLDPGIVYGYIDFRPIYRLYGSNGPSEAKANEIEKKILKELKARIEEAAGVTKTELLSVSEKVHMQNMLSRFGAVGEKEARELISRMRTQSGQSDMFLSALYRAKLLLPHIESVFKQKNLPIGLGRIPFVESSFNARAYSKGGAMGIWQFMPETAKEMIHASEESQWSDPLKQTASAARLLKMYRSMLPDWGSTVTSYNSGVGRVRRIMAKHKLKNVEELLNVEDEDGLGFAGKNFYSEFLAANLVEAYKEKLFENALDSQEFSLVFKGLAPFPKDFCDM